jgi:hypothetical protein
MCSVHDELLAQAQALAADNKEFTYVNTISSGYTRVLQDMPYSRTCHRIQACFDSQ